MTRRGLTIIELLVTMVVFGILGTALARLMVSNSRFVGRQEASLEARQTARAAMNAITSELRRVSDGGLAAASADSITVRIPYQFGIICRNASVSMIPGDSVVMASAVPGGIAYRSSTTGNYVINETVTGMVGGLGADCVADSIRFLPGGYHIALSQANIAPPGTVFYFFQKVTYKFAPSVMLPGRMGLWRRVGSGAYEEILAPFSSGARFAFLMGSRLTVQLTPPTAAELPLVQGLELRLAGESDRAPSGAANPTIYELAPRVKFMNRALP